MKIKNLLILTLFPVFLTAQNDLADQYISKFKDIAIEQMIEHGIPASITLAQGILESSYGQSYLATEGNNHFGIKCHEWTKEKIYRRDDDYVDGHLIFSCFRKYKNAEEAYRDHIEFLVSGRRYNFLFQLENTDYFGWANGLQSAGYATSLTYAEKLIELIERYELYKFDTKDSEENPATTELESINGVLMTITKEEETPIMIAERTGYSTDEIIENNEYITSIFQRIPANMRVFLQAKKNNYKGDNKWHIIKKGETMFSISQLYAIKLDKLYAKNKMFFGSEPATGETIKIGGFFKRENPPKLKMGKDLLPEPFEPPDLEPIDPLPDFEEDVFGEDDFGNDDIIIPIEPPHDGNEIPIPIEEPEFYIVKAGDTLYGISKKIGISVTEIMKKNNLPSYVIYIDQKLRIK